jgi:hypothetical protein
MQKSRRVDGTGTPVRLSRLLRMRIREENCNMVLLAAVTLLSVTVASASAWLRPASAANETTPVYVSSAAPSAVEKQSVRLADPTPVRVIGAPFVPNINPRER